MIRYLLAALSFKAFSMNTTTRTLYRRIGNSIGQTRRLRPKAIANKVSTKVSRGNDFFDYFKKHNVISDGGRILDFGTGWVHWYAIYMRLHHDVRVTMFDIWDNRQLHAFKATFLRLRHILERDHPDYHRIKDLLDKVVAVESFDDLYEFMDLEYVIEREGRLHVFEDNFFDCVLSSDVLEHVGRERVPQVIEDFHRILKPGGYSIHHIGLGDHLAHYDRSESKKRYLSFSSKTWKLLFENGVQYFNRLQGPEWLDLFGNNGFRLLDTKSSSTNIQGLRFASQYQGYDEQDLACTRLTIIHRKPKDD